MTEPSQTQGVEETATAWEPKPEPLIARPMKGPIDWDALIAKIERDFPKTLARLAE